MSRLSQTDIDLAKSADLIEYMLTVHPDRVVKRYDVRDIDHDSLVLYHDSYCRYSTNEVNDNIAYLTRYQGYSWRDAVLSLKRFYLDNPSDYEYEPHSYRTGSPKNSNGVDDISKSFYQPVSTNRIDLIKDYLHNQRGISEFVLDVLIKKELLYAATARGFGTDYACFASASEDFYSLRNISETGTQKLLFTKLPNRFWSFTSEYFCEPISDAKKWHLVYEMIPEEFPIFVCESPIDAISLYELTHKSGIYTALGALKANTLDWIIQINQIYHAGLRLKRKVFLAVDNDAAGDRFCKDFSYPRIKPQGKDWNEDLIKKRAESAIDPAS